MSDITTKASAAQAAVSPKPRSKQDSALHTPSWTDIVAAYHAEGNGDREMLLALLNAKAKEDERLAALDLLRAEQLRAYTAHLAVHGPLYPVSPASTVPNHGYPLPHAHYQQQYHPAPMHMHQHQHHHAASSSSSSSASSSSKTRKRNPTSRSPSLSHSSESRLSSPEQVRTPTDDERRMSGLSISDKDALMLPPPSNSLKRKSPSSAPTAASANAQATAMEYPAAKRVSPPRQLPSIADLLPASQAVEQHNLKHNKQNNKAEGAQQQQQQQQSSRAASPRSLQHILNQELRPLMSLSNYRAQTSDVRSSSSDEDELAE